MYIVGLDIGTTSISGALLNADNGEVLQTYTVKNGNFIHTENAWESIQDPVRIMATAQQLLDSIIDENPGIAVIGLTGQMHGIVYVDQDGGVVSPLYTWQDGRGDLTQENGKTLCEELRGKGVTGCYSGYGLITHLYNFRHGQVPKDAVSFCTIADCFGMMLTGRKTPLVHTTHAASFGFFDVENGDFRRELLKQVGADPDILPEITASVKLLGSYRGIPVSTAIGDNQASFMGSVTNAEDEILVNMGTGGQISLYSEQVIRGEDIETRPLIENSYLLVGASLCGGRAYALLADFFDSTLKAFGHEDGDPYKMMEQLLDAYEPGEPIQVDTAFAGTRDHPDKRGSITGISTQNLTPAALAYGVLDGIAEELYGRYCTMNVGQKMHHRKIVGSGNGMRRNTHLQQITAQKFDMEITLSARTEEAACGAALCAYTAVSDRSWKQIIGMK